MSEAAALSEVLGTEPGETIVLRAREISIRPLTLDQIADILIVVERLADRGVIELVGEDGKLARDFDEKKLLLRGGADAMEIMRIAAMLEAAFVKGLNLAEAARLAGAVWRVNKDFFVRNQSEILQSLEPLVGDAGNLWETIQEKAVARVTAILGRILSGVSSPPGTELKASDATR